MQKLLRLQDLIPALNAISAGSQLNEGSIGHPMEPSSNYSVVLNENTTRTDALIGRRQTLPEVMKVGKLVWVRRRDIDEFTGATRELTVGRGMIMELTNSFAKVYGKEGDFVFFEWVPFESKRLWLVAA